MQLIELETYRIQEGNDVTPEELKEFITTLISEEDLNQPLSDENLRTLLSSNYLIKVARRTVTKYRKEAGIGSTRIRRFN